MRWSITIGMCATMFGAVAFAKPYGMAGCGLGTMVIKSDDTMQVLAATTNGTSASQTFGITTGTSNCLPSSKMAKLERQNEFIAGNLVTLSKEMAQGNGIVLQAYAEVLGCQGDAYQEFARITQASYQDIFRAPGALAVLEATKNTLREHQQLATSCQWLI